MKKNYLIAVLIVLSYSSLHAQMQLSVGAKVGYSSSGMNRSEYGKKSVDAPLVGVVGNLSFNQLFSLQVEPTYMQKGGGYGFTYNKEKYFDYFKFRMIEVPLLAKFTIGKPKVKFIGLLGAYFGYNLNVERKFDDPSAGISETTQYNNFYMADNNGIKPNRIDGGLVFGTGFSVDIGKGRLFVDGRFAFGFGKWFEINPVDFQNKNLRDLSHRAVGINMGYTMPIWIKN